MLRKIIDRAWSEMRVRLLLALSLMALAAGLQLWEATQRFFGERQASAKITSIVQTCMLVERQAAKAGRPQITRLPCAEAEAAVAQQPGLVLARNRDTLVRLAFETHDGRAIEADVSPRDVDLSAQSQVGDVVTVAYDNDQPAASVRAPATAGFLPFGWIVWAFGVYRLARSLLKDPSARAVTDRASLEWKRLQTWRAETKRNSRPKPAAAKTMPATMPAPGHRYAAPHRKASVQRASRWSL